MLEENSFFWTIAEFDKPAGIVLLAVTHGLPDTDSSVMSNKISISLFVHNS